MKRQIVMCIAIIIILLSGCSKDTFKKKSSPEDAVKVLSSDKYQGRLAGTKGNDLAVEYLSKSYKELELDSYKDGSYLMEYEQEIFNPDKQQCKFKIEFEDGTVKEYKNGSDYIISIYAEDMDENMQITFDSKDPDISKKMFAAESTEEIKNMTAPSKCIMLKSKEFFYAVPLVANEPELKVTEALFEEIKDKKIKNISLRMKYHAETEKVNNVIGRIPGTDNSKAVILSAHFDHIGWAGKMIFNGAVDNASGIAVLLDTAKKLKEKSKTSPFNMDILICSFNGEEYYLRGSRMFINEISKQYKNLYNINIDCVGKKDGGGLIFVGDKQLNRKLIEEISECFPKDQLGSEQASGGTSDHKTFNEKGFCGVTIAQENMGGETSIHTNNDTIESIDSECLTMVSNSIYDFIVKKNGTIYKLGMDKKYKTPPLSNPKSNPDEETLKTADKMLYEIGEKLKIDEYEYVKLNGFSFWIANPNPITDMKDIEKYFPYMKFPGKIGPYSFESIKILENKIYAPYQKGSTAEQPGKIYKRDLSSESIHAVVIYYRKDTTQLKLEVFYSPYGENRFWAVNTYDREEIDLKGVNHFFIKDINSGKVLGIGRGLEIDGFKYNAGFFKYNVSGNTAKLIDSTKEEMLEIIKDINIDKIVKDLGI